MTTVKPPYFRFPLIWRSIALAMLAITVWLSLAPRIPQIAASVLPWDKAQHVLAYACLMWWCAQAFRKCSPLLWIVLLFLMGVSLELLQHQTAARHLDLKDVIANSIGVLLGFLLWLTPLGGTLQAIDSWAARRLALVDGFESGHVGSQAKKP